ncbi:MAG: MotA/TolQ/ExbB proton channel family protein, partial [Moraxellaceae bacterium]|nr:MotA/TolQ/ExbB proton channel family protein [Moraxellaceae bacterium]
MNFIQYWQYADTVTKMLFFLLIILSVISWITGLIRLYASIQLKKSVSDYLQNQVANKLEQLKL